MAQLCNIGGQVLYKTEDGMIKDFYGRFLYFINSREVQEWGSRKTILRFDGNTIRDFYNRGLYTFDGHFFRDYYGRILYIYERNEIAEFAKTPKYMIRS